jgi:hypothetical protein
MQGKFRAAAHCYKSSRLQVLVRLVVSFPVSGKSFAQPCLGVTRLKIEVAHNGEGSFARLCTVTCKIGFRIYVHADNLNLHLTWYTLYPNRPRACRDHINIAQATGLVKMQFRRLCCSAKATPCIVNFSSDGVFYLRLIYRLEKLV